MRPNMDKIVKALGAVSRGWNRQSSGYFGALQSVAEREEKMKTSKVLVMWDEVAWVATFLDEDIMSQGSIQAEALDRLVFQRQTTHQLIAEDKKQGLKVNENYDTVPEEYLEAFRTADNEREVTVRGERLVVRVSSDRS